jgi:cytidylate kinase
MNATNALPPVIAIDGPSASGKGTVAQRVAGLLGYHYLDSGALYRLVAVAAKRAGVAWDDEPALAPIAASLEARFDGDEIYLNDALVTAAVRSEEAGAGASKVAVWPAVRAGLLARQKAFRLAPGLVADGRDMATVVFPDANLKIFLTADVVTRAERRHKQLIAKGMSANITILLQDLQVRDERDSKRSEAPLRKTNDAILLDTTHLTIEAAVEFVIARYKVVTKVP